MRTRKLSFCAAVAALLLASMPAAAGAHIQVRPAQAAPLDPVLWTVLVPNERSEATVRIVWTGSATRS